MMSVTRVSAACLASVSAANFFFFFSFVPIWDVQMMIVTRVSAACPTSESSADTSMYQRSQVLSLSLSRVPYAERYKTTSLMQTKSFFFPSQNNLAFQGLLLIYLLLATTLISKTHTKSTCHVHK